MSDSELVAAKLQELGELKEFVVQLGLCFDHRDLGEIAKDIRTRIEWRLGGPLPGRVAKWKR